MFPPIFFMTFGLPLPQLFIHPVNIVICLFLQFFGKIQLFPEITIKSKKKLLTKKQKSPPTLCLWIFFISLLQGCKLNMSVD
jgi:hypothetical protein